MRSLVLVSTMVIAYAAHARAQTAPVPTAPAASASASHAATATTKTHAAHRKPATAATTKTARTPVVTPKHGAAPRKPVHPKAKLAVPSAAAKPAKPAAPAAPAPSPKPVIPPKQQIPPDEGTVTHLHIPRYVSLRSDEVNMRAGPAPRFPILWTYKRKELPVKIEREFDVWRLVEDMDGIKGWVHQATLMGKRTFVVTGTEPQTLRGEPKDDAEPVALLKPGVVGVIKACDAGADWCRVQAGDYAGYLPRSSFWGTDPGEAVTP